MQGIKKTHTILVAFVQSIDVVRKPAALIVSSGDVQELLTNFGEKSAIRDFQRSGISVRRSSRCYFVGLAL